MRACVFGQQSSVMMFSFQDRRLGAWASLVNTSISKFGNTSQFTICAGRAWEQSRSDGVLSMRNSRRGELPDSPVHSNMESGVSCTRYCCCLYTCQISGADLTGKGKRDPAFLRSGWLKSQTVHVHTSHGSLKIILFTTVSNSTRATTSAQLPLPDCASGKTNSISTNIQRSSMGYLINSVYRSLHGRVCDTVSASFLAFGLSTLDTSFSSILWLGVRGPP
jgi:ABC-type glycerol-3-phosphate transport system permease component